MVKTADIYDFVAVSASRLNRATPGPLQQPLFDALAATLDRELAEMVVALEDVASCQQTEMKAALSPESRVMVPFCAGLEEMGRQLIGHLTAAHDEKLEQLGLDENAASWVLQSRADALIAYILQLAHVHGLAFADPVTTESEQESNLLQVLEKRLRA